MLFFHQKSVGKAETGHRIGLMFWLCVAYVQKKITFNYTSVEVVQDWVVSKKLQIIKPRDLRLPGFQHPDTYMETGALHPVP